jgi:hypothetical protein
MDLSKISKFSIDEFRDKIDTLILSKEEKDALRNGKDWMDAKSFEELKMESILSDKEKDALRQSEDWMDAERLAEL